MSAYFDHPSVEAIRSEDIYNLFKRANKRSSEFISIELTDEKKRLSRSDKTQPLDFAILEATLIFRRADNCRILRMKSKHPAVWICLRRQS